MNPGPRRAAHPTHGPRRWDRLFPLPHPGPRRQVHQCVRQHLRCPGREDSKEPAADATRELLCREMDTHSTSRVHRPDPGLRRTAPSISPQPVRRSLQPAQAPPVPPATTTRPRRPGQRSASPAGSPAQGARRRDQRVLPSRVADLMKHLVRHHATSFEAVRAADPVHLLQGPSVGCWNHRHRPQSDPLVGEACMSIASAGCEGIVCRRHVGFAEVVSGCLAMVFMETGPEGRC